MAQWTTWPHLWILCTILAVVSQSFRTAGQKHLTSELTATGATLVRFLFGLPFAILFLFGVLANYDENVPGLNSTFWTFLVIAGVLQILATILLVQLFSLRNFAVGTTYSRTEAFLTAVIGALFFAEIVTGFGWVAIILSVAGVMCLTLARNDIGAESLTDKLFTKPAAIGLASGLCFAVCSLSLRKASLSLGIDNWMVAAGTTLVCMVTLQTILMIIYCVMRQPDQFKGIGRQWQVCVFVGFTSTLGSIGWFTAMTLERASYVKALGQIEFIVALGISTVFFKEKTNKMELMGMLLIAVGVLCLLAFG